MIDQNDNQDAGGRNDAGSGGKSPTTTALAVRGGDTTRASGARGGHHRDDHDPRTSRQS